MSTKSKMTNANSNTSNSRFVVLRNNTRVSDLDYASRDEAKSEYDHWHKIISRWPDGSKLEIVELKNNK